MNPHIPNQQISVATQMDGNTPSTNVGQGRKPIDGTKHAPLFEFENENPPIIAAIYHASSAKSS